MSLMLHCGAHAATRDELYALPQPAAKGKRHAPIHHAEYLELVEGMLDQYGYQIEDEAFGITQHGNRMFGLLQVKHQDLQCFDGGAFELGLRGSHDMSLPRGLAAGSRVFVCDNLAFNGSLTMSTKQTTNLHLRLPALMDDMVRELGRFYSLLLKQVDSYKLTVLDGRTADAAITQMVREDIVSTRQLSKLITEWDEPSHPEHAEDGASVWRLFNACTETLKSDNPMHPALPNLAGKTTKLHALCDRLAA